MIGERISSVVQEGDPLWPNFIIVTDGGAYWIQSVDVVRIRAVPPNAEETSPASFCGQRIAEVRTDDETGVYVRLESGDVIAFDSTFAASIDDVVRMVNYQTRSEAAEWMDHYESLRILSIE